MRISYPTAFVFAATLLVTGCGTAPTAPSASTAAPTAPVVAGPAAKAALDGERQRLASLFSGTPVVFVTTSDGNLRATVPRRYCFDAGDAKVKAALAAVLDRIAKSQSSTRSRLRIAVPNDPNTRNAQLGTDRAASVRDHLVAQGLSASRLQVTPGSGSEILELTVYPEPAPA